MTGVSGTVTASYVYDGDGQRVRATVDGVTTVFIGDHYEVQGGTVKQYYYADGVRVAENSGGTLYWLLTDHLGGTNVTLNSSGNYATELRYHPYGTMRYNPGGQVTSYRYTGQRWDSGTGLYWYRSRWYDPAIGRFIQPDTLVPDAGNPQDLNRYAYARNNPIRYNDPSGHVCVPCVIVVAAGVALLVQSDVASEDRPPSPEAEMSAQLGGALLFGSVTDAVAVVTEYDYVWDTPLPRYSPEWWVTAGLAAAPGVSKSALQGLKQAREARQAATALRLRSFTESNFRENLRRLTGKTTEEIRGLEAHHVLPQEFAKRFQEVGLNIHDPRFGSWVVGQPHRRWSYEYNRQWETFFEDFKKQGIKPTERQILGFAQQIARKYGFDVHFNIP